YTITVRNTGPMDATGVLVSNFLPSALTFLSASASQGSCAESNNIVLCNLDTVPAGAAATINILTLATGSGVITDVATVTKNETEVFLGNNTAAATTRVRNGFRAKVAIYGVPADD